VLVIGAGGLGSPVLTYLACAGVGHLYVADYDTVSLTNLNRQFLHGDADIGRSKTESAKDFIQHLNPEVLVTEIKVQITAETITELIQDKQVIVNCVDNIETRMFVNRACVQGGVPLVEGAINGFYGFVYVIKDGGPCLECLGYGSTVIHPPVPVLGTTAGVIGTLQANECIKIILGAGTSLAGHLLSYDGLEGSFDTIAIQISDTCSVHQAIRN
jgi:adenylyltransferase/sulfurtransferase